jgi:phytoene dehydrogenase-like protein
MTQVLVLGSHIQGLIAAALSARRGMDVTVVNFPETQNDNDVFHLPFALPHYIIGELGLEEHGLDIPKENLKNPFKKLPFYEGIKTLVEMFKSLEDTRPDYKEKAWRDAWGTFEIGRILSGYDDTIQSLFAESALLSLADLVKASELSDADQAEIIAICTLGAKTDPDAPGSAAAILSGLAYYEQKDSVYFQGSAHNLTTALKQACMSSNVNIVTEQHVETIETKGKEITSVKLNGGDVLTADHYILDFDPVILFKNYLTDHSILPAFKNRIIPKQNTKECIRAHVVLKDGTSILPSQIIAPSTADILSARSDMKKDGGAQSPVLSIMGMNETALDIIAQYFDPVVDSSDDAKTQAITNVLERNAPDIAAKIDSIEIVPMATQFGQPTFLGTMPLLQLFKIFFGHHSLAYDMPISNLLVCGYGQLCASHHHVHRGGARVASLLQSF